MPALFPIPHRNLLHLRGEWLGTMQHKTIAALLLAATSTAFADVPTQYTFKIVAREGTAASGTARGIPAGAELVQNDPALDNNGNVAVRYTINGTEGFFVYDAAANSGSVVLTESAGFVYSTSLDMLAGRMALTLNAGSIDVRDTAGALLYSFSAGGAEGVTGSFNRVRLTSDGGIGYRAAAAGLTKNIIDRYVGSTRVQTALASTDAAGLYSFLYSPTVNDSYQMGGKVDLRSGGAAVVRWQQDQSPVTVMAIAQTPEYNTISNGTDMNNAGEIAFQARVTADSTWRLLKGSGGALTTIASTDPSNPDAIVNTNFGNFPPVINNQGNVAFRPKNNWGDAVFIGDGATNVTLVHDGMFVNFGDDGTLRLGFGTTSRTAVIGNINLNDANQVAFIARIDDGTDALVIATPVPSAPTCGTSDYNGDGDFGTDADIQAFFACMAGNCCPTCFVGGSDFNMDGDFGTDADIESFFRVLAGQPC